MDYEAYRTAWHARHQQALKIAGGGFAGLPDPDEQMSLASGDGLVLDFSDDEFRQVIRAANRYGGAEFEMPERGEFITARKAIPLARGLRRLSQRFAAASDPDATKAVDKLASLIEHGFGLY